MDRGQRASELLNDPLLQEALQSIKNTLHDSWAETSDFAAREEMWYTLKGLLRFENYLEVTLENSKFDKAMLATED